MDELQTKKTLPRNALVALVYCIGLYVVVGLVVLSLWQFWKHVH